MAVTAAEDLNTMIKSQHDRESVLESRLAVLDSLELGRNKLILRSISDRIEETVICSELGISRLEMRVRGLFNVPRLEAYVGRDVWTPDGMVPVTRQHVLRVKEVMAGVSSRAFDRGRGHIKRLGDMEAHGDPTDYLGDIDTIVANVFGRDADKVSDVTVVVDVYREIVRAFVVPDL